MATAIDIDMDKVENILADYGKVIVGDAGLPYVIFKPHGPNTPLPGTSFAIEATNANGSFIVTALDADGNLNRSFHADVSGPSIVNSKAQVNWPGIGSVNAIEARLFAAVLTLAANIASEVNHASGEIG